MALRATFPAVARVSETPLAGLLRRHELGYKNVLDTLRISLANLESDYATMLARHLDRPREVKKLLAALFAAPGTIHIGSRGVTVRLMPAASDSERTALRVFLADVNRRRLSQRRPVGLIPSRGERGRRRAGAPDDRAREACLEGRLEGTSRSGGRKRCGAGRHRSPQ